LTRRAKAKAAAFKAKAKTSEGNAKREQTMGTVLVPWAGQFPMLKYKYIFQIKYTETILSNNTRKLLWFEITEMLIAV